MDKIVIIIHGYVISCIDRMNRCDICFFLYIEWIIYIVIKFIINYLCWIFMTWYLLTYIVIIHYFIIDTITWLCISLFLKIAEFVQWNFGINVDTRKVWVSYIIINVWFIWIICFTTVEMWVNSNKSPLLGLE